MKVELKNLFGTRKVILNEKETKQLIKNRQKQETEFIENLYNTSPNMIKRVIISALIMIILIKLWEFII